MSIYIVDEQGNGKPSGGVYFTSLSSAIGFAMALAHAFKANWYRQLEDQYEVRFYPDQDAATVVSLETGRILAAFQVIILETYDNE